MIIAQLTDVGIEKYVNQDCLLACHWEFPCSSGVEHYDLLIVADGIGSNVGGEIASSELISVMMEYFGRAFCECYREPRTKSVGLDIGNLLRSTIEYGHQQLCKITEAAPGFKGMGTTVVAVIIHGPWVYVAHVGDSRLYRIRNKQLERLTKDHSMVQLMLDQGKINVDQAFKHDLDNLITQGVCISDSIFVEIHRHDLNENDIFLLSSDGATNDTPIEVLCNLCKDFSIAPTYEELQGFCEQIKVKAIDSAIGATFDNLSIIAARVEKLVPCIEKHDFKVYRYGERLPVEPEVKTRHPQTYPYGVNAPSYRMYGWKAPIYNL